MKLSMIKDEVDGAHELIRFLESLPSKIRPIKDFEDLGRLEIITKLFKEALYELRKNKER